ncbi:MAG TPA: methylenetetrahydrofolate reductase [NAD(P)H] [Chloroflexota bacterium]|jgi:methylenetetrahydrofolate reductase (NADPH)|nr:methylenetetrahydrofolate reductase [NAD(P)H] [Chloroflexota bacterium]
MKITTTLSRTGPCFSFEFFPPRNDEGMAQLMETIANLRRLEPSFVSVTYGAGGSSRERTLELVSRFKAELGIEAMAHLTCVGASRQELQQTLDRLAASGVENIMALRGDPPRGQTRFVPVADGLAHATDLIELIASRYDFGIGAACYPEGHPESPTLEHDLAYVTRKVQLGAQFLITQAFFDNIHYFTFVERARAVGIEVPIIPGIMPITDLRVMNRIMELDPRTTVPDALRREIVRRADNPEAVVELGVAYATLQCEELLRGGAPGIHFYTLNRSPATSAILAALQISQPWLKSSLTLQASLPLGRGGGA